MKIHGARKISAGMRMRERQICARKRTVARKDKHPNDETPDRRERHSCSQSHHVVQQSGPTLRSKNSVRAVRRNGSPSHLAADCSHQRGALIVAATATIAATTAAAPAVAPIAANSMYDLVTG